MATYFGYCDPSTGYGTGTGTCNINQRIYWQTAGYACPGSGTQNVIHIGVQGRSVGTMNMGIYATDKSLIAYGTSPKVVPTDTTYANHTWTVWTNAELTWVVGSALTGGTTYLIAICCSTNGPNIFGNSAAPANTLQYSAATDYTSAMPDPLPSSSGYTYEYNLRVLVEAAAGGLSIPVAMAHYRRRRM